MTARLSAPVRACHGHASDQVSGGEGEVGKGRWRWRCCRGDGWRTDSIFKLGIYIDARRAGRFNVYVALQFSVLHQQINCCFILALANNQNIITELVVHGAVMFYSAHPGKRTHTQRHTAILFIHAPKCMQRLNSPHTFTESPTQGTGALLFDATRQALAGFCFTPFRASFLGVMRGGLGCGARLAP